MNVRSMNVGGVVYEYKVINIDGISTEELESQLGKAQEGCMNADGKVAWDAKLERIGLLEAKFPGIGYSELENGTHSVESFELFIAKIHFQKNLNSGASSEEDKLYAWDELAQGIEHISKNGCEQAKRDLYFFLRRLCRVQFNYHDYPNKNDVVAEIIRVTTREGLYDKDPIIRMYSLFALIAMVNQGFYTERGEHYRELGVGINELFEDEAYGDAIEYMENLIFVGMFPGECVNKRFMKNICKAIEAGHGECFPTYLTNLVMCESTHEAIVGLIEKELDGGNEALGKIMGEFVYVLSDKLEKRYEDSREGNGDVTVYDTEALKGLLTKLEQRDGVVQEEIKKIRQTFSFGVIQKDYNEFVTQLEREGAHSHIKEGEFNEPVFRLCIAQIRDKIGLNEGSSAVIRLFKWDQLPKAIAYVMENGDEMAKLDLYYTMRKIARGEFNEEMMGDKEGTVRELVRLTTQEGLYHENAAIRGYSTHILSHLVFKKLYTKEAHMEQVAKGINELYTSGQYYEGIECLTDLTFSDNYPVASLNGEFIKAICKAIEAKRAALIPTCLSKMVLCEKTHETIIGLIEKELDGGNETLKSIMNDFLMQLLDELELLHESDGNPTVHDTPALRGLLAKLEQWEGALQDKIEEIRNMLSGGKPSFLS